MVPQSQPEPSPSPRVSPAPPPPMSPARARSVPPPPPLLKASKKRSGQAFVVSWAKVSAAAEGWGGKGVVVPSDVQIERAARRVAVTPAFYSDDNGGGGGTTVSFDPAATLGPGGEREGKTRASAKGWVPRPTSN